MKIIKRAINGMAHWFGYHVTKRPFCLRESTEFVRDNFGKGLTVAEVGVFEGINSESLLKHLNIKKLYLIDPYFYEDISDGSDMHLVEYKLKEAEEVAKEKVAKIKGDTEVIFLKMSSDLAVDMIPDDMDFIYIDGNHSYDFVSKDIKNYWKKVKKGGLLAGHNIEIEGVYRSLVEFLKKNNLKEYFLSHHDWGIIKE